MAVLDSFETAVRLMGSGQVDVSPLLGTAFDLDHYEEALTAMRSERQGDQDTISALQIVPWTMPPQVVQFRGRSCTDRQTGAPRADHWRPVEINNGHVGAFPDDHDLERRQAAGGADRHGTTCGGLDGDR